MTIAARSTRIDRELVRLFAERMRTAAGIAAYKKEHHLPVLDPLREREKLDALSQLAPEEFSDYTRRLYIQIFELSRSYQDRLLGTASPLPQRIEQALANTPALFPEKAMVACQGVAGAYAQLACEQALPHSRRCSTSRRF